MGRPHFYFAEKRTFLFGVDMEEIPPCNNYPKCDSLCHSEVSISDGNLNPFNERASISSMPSYIFPNSLDGRGN